MVTKNLEIFNTNQPLEFIDDRPIFKYDLFYRDEDVDKLSVFSRLVKLDVNVYKPFEFFSELPPEKFTKWDFLQDYGNVDMIVNQKVVDVFMKHCPDDIQALPIIIRNKSDKYGEFENRDYFIINIFKLAAVFPENKVIINNGFFESYPYVGDISCLNGNMIVRDKRFFGSIFFHPTLAKEFAKFKGITFQTEEDIAYYKCFTKPEA